ncbi:MAG: succinate dehydrogenase [Hyphomicrobiaceae bacterium]
MNVRLYVLQRLTAALMVPLIAVHLIVIFYATRKGLSAAEILGRTRGSVLWALYYGTFVIAAAIHGAIGVRSVLREWGPRALAHSARGLDLVMWGFGLLLVLLGLRAVAAVVL